LTLIKAEAPRNALYQALSRDFGFLVGKFKADFEDVFRDDGLSQNSNRKILE